MGIFASLLGRAPKIPQPTYAELTADDIARLDMQREVVAAAVRQRYNLPLLAKNKSDLKVIQQLLEDKVFTKAQTFELQCVGIVFGDVLASELTLHWVMMTDEYGCDPVLRFKNTSLQLNALTMISKRVENDEPLNVVSFFDVLHKDIESLKVQVTC
jgi:hypothetical protein